MTWPREGSREIDEGIIVSEHMDWCNSPLEPVPYRIWAKQVDAADLAPTVRQTDDRSHVKNSLVLRCYGDEPGIGGGVISGTTGAECTPKTWSDTVLAEGRNMVRHDDEWWMNHGNTWGLLYYIKDSDNHDINKSGEVDPLLQMRKMFDSLPPGSDQYVALDGNAHDYSASPEVVPPASQQPKDVPTTRDPVPMPPVGAPAAGAVVWGTFDGATGLVGIARGQAIVDDAARAVAGKPAVTRTPFMRLPTGIDLSVPQIGTGLRSSAAERADGCKLVKYRNALCPETQRHHAVADRSFRPGKRGTAVFRNSNGRIGLTEGSGLVLCLKGNAQPASLGTGHSIAQTYYDSHVEAGSNTDGLIRLDEAERIGAIATARGALKDGRICVPQLLQDQLRTYHDEMGLPGNTLVRANDDFDKANASKLGSY